MVSGISLFWTPEPKCLILLYVVSGAPYDRGGRHEEAGVREIRLRNSMCAYGALGLQVHKHNIYIYIYAYYPKQL